MKTIVYCGGVLVAAHHVAGPRYRCARCGAWLLLVQPAGGEAGGAA